MRSVTVRDHCYWVYIIFGKCFVFRWTNYAWDLGTKIRARPRRLSGRCIISYFREDICVELCFSSVVVNSSWNPFQVELLLRTFALMIIWHTAWYFQEGNTAVTPQLGSATATSVNNTSSAATSENHRIITPKTQRLYISNKYVASLGYWEQFQSLNYRWKMPLKFKWFMSKNHNI